MDIRAAEISAILKQQIANFGTEAEVAEVGQVLSVGDGIARVYGLDSVKAGEMVEFPGGIKGMALNLESDNVGVVIFGEDRTIRLWDVALRRFTASLPSGEGRVSALAYGPDGRYLAAGFEPLRKLLPAGVAVLDAARGTPLGRLTARRAFSLA